MKICIVSSVGGHLTEIRQLKPAYDAYPHFFVLNDKVTLPPDMSDKTYLIAHSERDWRLFVNLWEAYRILRRERPTVILSAGAGPVVPFAIIGNLFFGTYVIYIETITRIHSPSLTGRLMRYLAHRVFFQWEPLAAFFPRGEYGGQVV